jgi:hypothetical protein
VCIYAYKEEKDIYGCWRKGKHVSDVNNDVDLPYPDAKVAGKLCIGGHYKYVVKDGSGVTYNFLPQHVVSSIPAWFSANVAKVLAKLLLWMLFSSERNYLPQAMRDCVQTENNNIHLLPAHKNLVKKILLVVTGKKGNVYLDEVVNDQNQMFRQSNERIHSQISALRHSGEDLKATQQQHQVEGRCEFQT